MNIYEQIDKYKQKLDCVRPFGDDTLEQIRKYYRIGLTWSTNALEGNTLTESETKVLLEDGLTASGKPLRDTFEAFGHDKAYEFMFSLVNKKDISEDDILTLHRLFYKSIDENEAGFYRRTNVFITGSRHSVTAHTKVPGQMSDLVEWIKTERKNYHPVRFAAQLHLKFVFIHPFIDGNGRVSRLLMNLALIQDGYLLAIIPPIIRNDYIQSLEKAHSDPSGFENLVAEQVLESYKEMARLLHIDLKGNDMEMKL